MGSKMSHDKRCSKPQVELFFRLFEAHHGGHLFVATKKWDERCAYALMQKEMIIRLYNHVYADPAYWNDLGVEDRIFQLASAIAVVEPDAVFVEQRRHCSMASVLYIRFSTRCKCCCRVLPGVIRMNSLSIVAGGRAKCGSSVRLRSRIRIERLSISPERPRFAMRWVMSMAWPVSTMSSAKNCGHTRRPIAEGCMASHEHLTFLNTWMADRITVENPKHGRQ